MKKRITIDLGTATTRIFDAEAGVIFSSPSVVAIDNKTKKIIATGIDAKNMLGRSPQEISVVAPIRRGAISDFDVACAMIRVFLNATFPKSTFRPRAEIVVSPEMTPMEQRVLIEAAERSGVKVTTTVETPIAKAHLSQIDLSSPTGQMILDIGAGTVCASVLSFGGVVCSCTSAAAGDEMDKNIQDYISSVRGVIIGKNTAEEIKCTIGSAHPATDGKSMTVIGRTKDTGLPCELTVTSEEIRDAISPTLLKILHVIKSALEATPAELAYDLKSHGIILTGGASALLGLGQFIEENIGLGTVGAQA